MFGLRSDKVIFMNTTPNNANTTDAAFARLAERLLDVIDDMAQARIEYAEAHGIKVTDEEIVASVRASLLRMMAD